MVSKKNREKILNKYGGHCSYCGCDLTGTKWHIDHANPVERKFKRTGNQMVCADTGRILTEEDFKDGKFTPFKMTPSKLVVDGYHKPENHVIENMMPACASCNINKHSMNIEDFRRFIGRFINSLNNNSVQYKIAKRYGLIQETGIEVKFFFETYNPSVTPKEQEVEKEPGNSPI